MQKGNRPSASCRVATVFMEICANSAPSWSLTWPGKSRMKDSPDLDLLWERFRREG
jgi:hypothetical protein